MKKIKKIIFLLIFVFLLTTFLIPKVPAKTTTTNKVLILNLHYKNGILSLNNKIIKYGYAPDRKLQPSKGFKLSIIGKNNIILNSFNFEIPNKIFTDVIKNNKTIGGVVLLNETNFSLVLPFYKEAEEIKIYNPQGREILNLPLTTNKKKISFSLLLIFLFLIAFFCFLKRKKHNLHKHKF